MATEQDTIMQAIAQTAIEAARAVVKAKDVARTVKNVRMQNVAPKISGPIRQQPTFNQEAEDKYSKLKNFI